MGLQRVGHDLVNEQQIVLVTLHMHTHTCAPINVWPLNSACGYSLIWNPNFVHFNCYLCPSPSYLCALVC